MTQQIRPPGVAEAMRVYGGCPVEQTYATNTNHLAQRAALPRLSDLRGIDPDLTGGDTTEEWLAKQRGEA